MKKDRIIFDNTPGVPPGKFRIGQTNADRIRAMSDEELAAVLVLEPMEEKIPFCQNKPECYKLLDENRDIPEEMCAKCMLDWLKQEVDE